MMFVVNDIDYNAPKNRPITLPAGREYEAEVNGQSVKIDIWQFREVLQLHLDEVEIIENIQPG